MLYNIKLAVFYLKIKLYLCSVILYILQLRYKIFVYAKITKNPIFTNLKFKNDEKDFLLYCSNGSSYDF